MPQDHNLLVLVPFDEEPPAGKDSDLRGIKLFKLITRRLAFARRSHEDFHYNEELDFSSSSSSSSGSSKPFRCGYFRSGSSSSSSSDLQASRRRPDRSASSESLRRAFGSLSLGGRSRSTDAGGKETKRKTKKPEPKRILRQPVSYAYAKGLSGLPTRRIPKSSTVCQECDCRMKYR